MKQAVAYIRVSTAKQGRSGLGLDAQREAIEVARDLMAECLRRGGPLGLHRPTDRPTDEHVFRAAVRINKRRRMPANAARPHRAPP